MLGLEGVVFGVEEGGVQGAEPGAGGGVAVGVVEGADTVMRRREDGWVSEGMGLSM